MSSNQAQDDRNPLRSVVRVIVKIALVYAGLWMFQQIAWLAWISH